MKDIEQIIRTYFKSWFNIFDFLGKLSIVLLVIIILFFFI